MRIIKILLEAITDAASAVGLLTIFLILTGSQNSFIKLSIYIIGIFLGFIPLFFSFRYRQIEAHNSLEEKH
jgi:hypothetical protein